MHVHIIYSSVPCSYVIKYLHSSQRLLIFVIRIRFLGDDDHHHHHNNIVTTNTKYNYIYLLVFYKLL